MSIFKKKSTAVELAAEAFGEEYPLQLKRTRRDHRLSMVLGPVIGFPLIAAGSFFLESSFLITMALTSLGTVSLMGIPLFGGLRASLRLEDLISDFYRPYGIGRRTRFSSADFTPGQQLDEFSYEFPDGPARISVIADGIGKDPLVMISRESPKQILNPTALQREISA